MSSIHAKRDNFQLKTKSVAQCMGYFFGQFPTLSLYLRMKYVQLNQRECDRKHIEFVLEILEGLM